MKKILLILIAAMTLIQCAAPDKKTEKITIVCTTSMIADAVSKMVPENVSVISLMGPGVDPHLYKATQGDLGRLQNADVIVYNGLHLEGKMGDVLEKLGRIKTVFALAEGVPKKDLLQLAADTASHDPHIWFDLSLWAKACAHLRDNLAKKYPTWQSDLDAHFFDFEQSLLATHNWAINKLDSLPDQNKTLVTAHDAFSYFGRAYGLKVKGLQGISTASEFGLQDVSSLVSYISTNKIPAVFVESSVPKKSIEAVIEGCQKKGHNVALGGELYSDALGEKKNDTESLLGAFRANVNTIFNGLNKPAK